MGMAVMMMMFKPIFYLLLCCSKPFFAFMPLTVKSLHVELSVQRAVRCKRKSYDKRRSERKCRRKRCIAFYPAPISHSFDSRIGIVAAATAIFPRWNGIPSDLSLFLL